MGVVPGPERMSETQYGTIDFAWLSINRVSNFHRDKYHSSNILFSSHENKRKNYIPLFERMKQIKLAKVIDPLQFLIILQSRPPNVFLSNSQRNLELFELFLESQKKKKLKKEKHWRMNEPHKLFAPSKWT